MRLLILSFLLGTLGFNNPKIDTIPEWTLVKEDQGMKLYNRQVPGYEDKEVKLVFKVDASLDKTKDFLFDPNNIAKWMAGCSYSTTEKVNGESKSYYAIFDAPWPVTDRDDVGIIKLMEKDHKGFQIIFESKPEAKPINKNYVRIPYSKGLINVTRVSNAELEIEYQLHVNRGGSLPYYIKNHLENSSPINTGKNIKDNLEK